MPLNDHVLLLQLERAQEVLKDEVEDGLDTDAFADVDHDHDEYAYASHDHDERYADSHNVDEHESRLDDLAGRVINLEEMRDVFEGDIAAAHERNRVLLERVTKLEAALASLEEWTDSKITARMVIDHLESLGQKVDQVDIALADALRQLRSNGYL